jgi:hypothetical protein
MVLRNVATNYTFEQQRQEINLLADDVNAIDGEVTTLQGEVTTLQSNVTSIQSLQGTEDTDSPTFNNLTVTGYISGPASMTIDPAAVGDNTGTLVIAGNLQVDGVTTTVNSETLTVSDKNITLASNATDNSTANGAGLTVAGSNAALTYNGTTDEWELNRSLRLSGQIFCQNVEPSNNIQLLDGKKLLCGADSDLQIYHDGNNSFIKETGTGRLTIATSQLQLTNAADSEVMIRATQDSTVELFHNGTKKFETHSNGVMTSGRLFINSTNGGFDYNSVADTLEVLTTNGSTHSEFTSSSFLPAASNSKGLGANTKRWSNVYVSNAIYLNDRIVWGSYSDAYEPTGVNEGDQYYNTTDSKMKIYDGSAWVDFGGSSSATYTITKSSSHDNWYEGTGLGHQTCGGGNRIGVSHASSTHVTMTLAFSPNLPTITEFKVCMSTVNGTNIDYKFNGTGSYASTGIGSSDSNSTLWDATSVAQSAGAISQLELKGGNGSGNTHVYVYYIKVNGVYFAGASDTTYTATL